MNEFLSSLVGLFPRAVLTSIAVLLLVACATPADPKRMAVPEASITSGFPASLQHAMCVRSVSGGEETNPNGVSKVGNAELREALTTSLSNAGLLAPQNSCKYLVDVNLLGLSTSIGFAIDPKIKITSYTNYKVYDGAGNPILLATISAFHEAGSHAGGAKRAEEGAMRGSISQFLSGSANIFVQFVQPEGGGAKASLTEGLLSS